MSRSTPLVEKTALPESVKIATVAQEVVKRCKNTSRHLAPNVINNILGEYIRELERGGFHPHWVNNAINAGLNTYIRMVENELKGVGPINRPEKATRMHRKFKVLCGQNSRFKKSSKKAPPPPRAPSEEKTA